MGCSEPVSSSGLNMAGIGGVIRSHHRCVVDRRLRPTAETFTMALGQRDYRIIKRYKVLMTEMVTSTTGITCFSRFKRTGIISDMETHNLDVITLFVETTKR